MYKANKTIQQLWTLMADGVNPNKPVNIEISKLKDDLGSVVAIPTQGVTDDDGMLRISSEDFLQLASLVTFVTDD